MGTTKTAYPISETAKIDRKKRNHNNTIINAFMADWVAGWLVG